MQVRQDVSFEGIDLTSFHNFQMERGGIVCNSHGELQAFEIKNISDKKKCQYAFKIPPHYLKNGLLVGFWHTHKHSKYPSLLDVWQLLRLNSKHKNNLSLYTLKWPYYSVVFLKYGLFPIVTVEKIRT